MSDPDDDEQRRRVALRNANAILQARQRAEVDLREAKDQLERQTLVLDRSLAIVRATLQATTDAILVTDNDRRVIDYNDNYLRMWRVPQGAFHADMPHTALASLLAYQLVDPAQSARRLDEIHASGQADAFDELLLTDGRILERHMRLQSVEGRNIGRVWSFRDVTDERLAQRALLEESRTLDLINRTGTAIASTLDLQTLLQTVTDAATEVSDALYGAFFYHHIEPTGTRSVRCTLAGIPAHAISDADQLPVAELFRPGDAGDTPIRLDDVLEDGRYRRFARNLGLPAGEFEVRSFLAVPVILRSGETVGGLYFGHPEPGMFSERDERLVLTISAQAATAIDNARLYEGARRLAAEREQLIDAERAARAESERLSRLKDEFLATLSHELRTPLTSILGWSSVLQQASPLQSDELRRGVETIARNARAQAQLIDDLLDMNRIISGKIRLDMQLVDLRMVVRDALESVRPSAQVKRIELTALLDDSGGYVHGDRRRLQQVVWNLLTNAVKFTPAGGRIEAIVRCIAHDVPENGPGNGSMNNPDRVELVIHDTGSGISAAFLPHVFDRFRQADSSTTRQHGGLGLGLSIVKQLVQLHGGSVSAESAGANQGATFTVVLPSPQQQTRPTASDPKALARAEDIAPQAVSLAGMKVLVVDDESDSCELISRVLTQAGAQVITASSAEEGLPRVENDHPDVMVSDIGMPLTDGYQFMRKVRALPAASGGRIPAVALTAFARSEDRTRAMLAGYQIHLAKPVEPTELVATVNSLVVHHREHLRSDD